MKYFVGTISSNFIVLKTSKLLTYGWDLSEKYFNILPVNIILTSYTLVYNLAKQILNESGVGIEVAHSFGVCLITFTSLTMTLGYVVLTNFARRKINLMFSTQMNTVRVNYIIWASYFFAALPRIKNEVKIFSKVLISCWWISTKFSVS